MNNIQIFKYENNDVRTVEMNGEPWFVDCDPLQTADHCPDLDAGSFHPRHV